MAVQSGVVRYVGITKNIAVRAARHLAQKGIAIRAIPGLTAIARDEARAVEQVLIERFGLDKNGGTLLNQINSIAQSNPIYAQAVARGAEVLKSIGF
jgi:filamentous hemagglutinin